MGVRIAIRWKNKPKMVYKDIPGCIWTCRFKFDCESNEWIDYNDNDREYYWDFGNGRIELCKEYIELLRNRNKALLHCTHDLPLIKFIAIEVLNGNEFRLVEKVE